MYFRRSLSERLQGGGGLFFTFCAFFIFSKFHIFARVFRIF